MRHLEVHLGRPVQLLEITLGAISMRGGEFGRGPVVPVRMSYAANLAANQWARHAAGGHARATKRLSSERNVSNRLSHK